MSDNKALLKNLEDTLLRELSNATGEASVCFIVAVYVCVHAALKRPTCESCNTASGPCCLLHRGRLLMQLA
jgi:hypothetical protein